MNSLLNWFSPTPQPIKKRYNTESIEQVVRQPIKKRRHNTESIEQVVRQLKESTDRLYQYLIIEITDEDSSKPVRRRRTEVEMLEDQFSSWKK